MAFPRTVTNPCLRTRALAGAASANTNELYCRAVSINNFAIMNKLCASLLAIFLTGCGTKKSDFTSIEFLKYNWSRYNDTTKLEVPLFIKCRMYVIIDHTGLGKAFVYKSYPKPSTFYYSFTPDKTIIEKVLLASSKTDILKNYLKEKGPMVYDGPSLKLLIKNSKSKSILIDYLDSPPCYI